MTNKILFVDDDAATLTSYRMLNNYRGQVAHPFVIETAPDGEQGLAAMVNQGPYAVIISDMQMPEMNGIEFLRAVRKIAPDTVRMMLTGYADVNLAIDSVNEGHIFRFLTKPCKPHALIAAIQAGIEQYRLIHAEKELLEKTLAGSVQVLTEVLALVNSTAFGRSARIRDRVKKVAAQLQVQDAWQLEIAAMLSQTGCVAVPEEILKKVDRGDELSWEEMRIFQGHPRVGHDLIAQIPRLDAVADAIAYQEKRFDGSGVPADAIRGTDIPLGARIFRALLDFDTLEVQGQTPQDALERLKHRSDWYDPAVLEALEKVLQSETRYEMKEQSVQDLMDKLDALLDVEAAGSVHQVRVRDLFGHMMLAGDVLSNRGLLLLRKGQEITIPLLHRLRNFAVNTTIQEPLLILVAHQVAS